MERLESALRLDTGDRLYILYGLRYPDAPESLLNAIID